SNIVQLNLDFKNNPLLSNIVRNVAFSKNLIIIAGLVFLVVEAYPSNGLFEMIKQNYPGSFSSVRDLFDYNLHITDKAVKAFYNFMGELNKLVLKAEPTFTHLFIKKLANMKKLKRVYTQNIDNLEEKAGLKFWNFEKFKRCQAQVVQLYRTLANLQCNVCTNVYSFTQEYCDIFTKGEIPNCTECEKREYKRNLQGKRKHTIEQLKLAVILYSDKHPKKLEIGKIAAYNQDKVDCLIIIGTSLRIPEVKCLIKKFTEAVHDRNGYMIIANATNVVTKEWNEIIDYQIKGTCDEWIKLIDMELSNVKKSKKRKRNEIDCSLNFTNNNSLRNKKKSLTK
ncbi:27028_t:CDS:2, partial [Gigaspora margarita]